jgi:hypothetical protein
LDKKKNAFCDGTEGQRMVVLKGRGPDLPNKILAQIQLFMIDSHSEIFIPISKKGKIIPIIHFPISRISFPTKIVKLKKIKKKKKNVSFIYL